MNKYYIEISKGRTGLIVSSVANKNMFFGNPHGGAMLPACVENSNILLGQRSTLPVLEWSLKASKMRFNFDAKIVLAGATMNWKLDDVVLVKDKVIEIMAGQELKGDFAKDGLHAYMAIDRKIIGLDDYKIKLGRKNNILKRQSRIKNTSKGNFIIQIQRGPEWNFLSQEGKATMMNFQGHLSKDMNRMGAYINGPNVEMKNAFPKKSVCTFPGVIQLLPNGQLIVLLQDAQTTGGYPRIAYLDTEALSHFNQLIPGQKIEWSMIL